MMRFDIISLFPESMQAYTEVSILKRAQKDGLIDVVYHQLRDYAHDKHQTVDDVPYGGGPGMVLKPEPLTEALESVEQKGSYPRTRKILLSAKGKIFTQKEAERLKEYDRLILVAGRYEGVDERFIEECIDEELSVGEYVLTGGELPALIVVDAVTRLLPGVLGNEESALHESYTEEGVKEHPQYTRPEEFRGKKVPKVLLSGHHKEILEWKKKQSS